MIDEAKQHGNKLVDEVKSRLNLGITFADWRDVLNSCPWVTREIEFLKAIFIISLLEAFIHLSIASTIAIPELINVLNVSDIWAISDFKIKFPKRGIFNIKLSKKTLPPGVA